MNSISKDMNSNSHPKRETKETLKPIKPRKFNSFKEVENTTSSLNYPLNLNIVKIEKKKDIYTQKENKEEYGITGYNSLQNVNKYIQVISCKSRAGNQVDGSRKTNQDSFLINTNILNLEEYCSFGVYDGHGIVFLI